MFSMVHTIDVIYSLLHKFVEITLQSDIKAYPWCLVKLFLTHVLYSITYIFENFTYVTYTPLFTPILICSSSNVGFLSC